jgi:hypothetical protein
MYVVCIKRTDLPCYCAVYDTLAEAEARVAIIGEGFIVGPLVEVMERLVELKKLTQSDSDSNPEAGAGVFRL